MADIGEITATLRANVTDFQRKLKQAEDSLKSFGSKTKDATGKMNPMLALAGKLGTAFLGFQAAMRVARMSMRALIQDTTKLDTAMGQVDTLTDKSRAGMEALTHEVQNLSRVVPKTAQDLAMGLYETLSSGILNTSDAMIVMSASAKLAASGLLDTFSAVDAVTTALNAWNMKAKDVTQVTDAFFECVPGHTRVLLADGSYSEIAGLQDATVIAYDGRAFLPSRAEWIPKGDAPTIRITTKSGRSLELTPNHPLLAVAADRDRRSTQPPSWRPASELRVGDRVGVPAALPFFGSVEVPDHISGFLGLWLAEGHSGVPRIATLAYGNEVHRWAESLGCTVSEYFYEHDDGSTSQIYGLTGDGTVGGNPAIELLRKYGLWDARCGTKHVPEAVFRWNRECLANFLHWMFNGDGWLTVTMDGGKRKTLNLGYASKSETLVRDVSHLLLRFGIMGRVSYRSSTDSWVWQTGRHEEVSRFLSFIGIDRPSVETFHDYTPDRTIASPGNVIFDPITSIEDAGVQEVFDLFVPSLHNFVASDVLAHNTVKLGKITIPTLADSIGNTASSAALAGVSLDHLGAAIATMTKLGVDANVTTNALNRLFLTVAQSLPKTAAAAKAMGLEWTSASLRAKGLPQFLKDIETATNGDIDALASLQLDLRAIRSLFILSGTGAQLFAETLKEFENKQGAADEAFLKTNTRIEAQWQLIRNRLAIAFQELGSRAIPPVVEALKHLTENFEPPLVKAERLLDELGKSTETTALRASVSALKLQESLRKVDIQVRSFGKSRAPSGLQILDPEVMRRVQKGIPPIPVNIKVSKEEVRKQMDEVAAQIATLAENIQRNPLDVVSEDELNRLSDKTLELQKQMKALEEYDKLLKDINENVWEQLSALTELDKTALPYFTTAVALLGNMGGQLGEVSALFAMMFQKQAEAEAKAKGFVLDPRKLGYFRLRAAVEATESAIASVRTQIAGVGDSNEDMKNKLTAQYTDLRRQLGIFEKALADVKMPTINWSDLDPKEVAKQWQDLRKQLGEQTLALSIEVDPEKRKTLERDIAETRAQMDSLKGDAVVPLEVAPSSVEKAKTRLKEIADKLDELRTQYTLVIGVDPEATARIRDEIQSALDERFKIGVQLEGGGGGLTGGGVGQINVPKIPETLKPTKLFKFLPETIKQTEAWADALRSLRTQMAGARGDLIGLVVGFLTAIKNLQDEYTKQRNQQIADKVKGAAESAIELPTKEALSGALSAMMPTAIGLGIGLLGNALKGLFSGGGDSAMVAAQKANTLWLKKVSEGLAEFTDSFLQESSRTWANAMSAIQAFQADMQAWWENQPAPGYGGTGAQYQPMPDLEAYLEQFGLTIERLTELLKEIGYTWDGTVTTLGDVQAKLEEYMASFFDSFKGGIDLIDKSLDARGITDAMARFQEEVQFVIDKVAQFSPEFAAKLEEARKSPEAWAKFVQDFIARLQAGDITVFQELGDISVSDFLNWIASADSSLKGLSDTASGLSEELRNVPYGYKVALARFQADTGEAARGLRERIDGIPVPGPTDVGLGQTATDIQRTAMAFTSGISAFSVDATDVLQNELLPALQMWADAFNNPLTGAGFTPTDLSKSSPITTVPDTTRASTAPPLGANDATGSGTGAGNVFHIGALTVVSNDPDDMLAKIETRAKQKARLGGVTKLDMAVSPLGQRGSGTGVR